jgi:amino acid transporter
MLLWLAGGVISFIGALCYAELAVAYPDPGGDYRYLVRAYGPPAGFFFAWARMTVIQPGTIAMLAFMIGDYASEIFALGNASAAKYAAFLVLAVTGMNIAGIRFGKGAQRVLTVMLLAGLAIVAAAGFLTGGGIHASGSEIPLSASKIGMALIFVLLTYGGWNEAVYLSGELRGTRRGMLTVLLVSLGIVTSVYLLVNAAYIRGLGLPGVAGSQAVAADLLRQSFGSGGATFISFLVILAAFSTMNAVVITGARTSYALGKDFSLFDFMGNWNEKSGNPVNALIIQGVVSLALVAFGTGFRSGFASMVDYTAPVFWLFFLLGGISLFILRYREPQTPRPFRVPLYPFIPIMFCASCTYLLYSSLMYTGKGALVGVAVLVLGLPLFLMEYLRSKQKIGMGRSMIE